MKSIVLAAVIAMMTWVPTCDDSDSPTSSSGDNYSDYNPPTGGYKTSVYGTVFDEATGLSIDSAMVCHSGSCFPTGKYSDGYAFFVPCSSLPCEVQFNVSHPDYNADSVVLTLRGVAVEHDFYLTPK